MMSNLSLTRQAKEGTFWNLDGILVIIFGVILGSFLVYVHSILLYYLGLPPHPVTVTTRIITFLIGNPYKPSFVTVTGWGGRSNLLLRPKDLLLCPIVGP